MTELQNQQPNLSVFDFNCWGLKFVSKHRAARLHAIATHLSRCHHDLVTLQEVWCHEDYHQIRTICSSNLPYGRYFHSGTLGSGLAILSRYPFLSSSCHTYALAGKPLYITQGDFYVGKGIASVVIEHPTGGLIELFTTHMVAGYGHGIKPDIYAAQRLTEAWELARMVRKSISQGRHVIVTGDLNSRPTSDVISILKSHAGITDAWEMMHKHQVPTEKEKLSPIEGVRRLGLTCDSPVNSFSKPRLYLDERNQLGQRLDYIFYYANEGITPISCEVDLIEPAIRTPSNAMCSHSDHFAVHAQFHISQANIPSIIRPDTTKITVFNLCRYIKLLRIDLAVSERTSVRLTGYFFATAFLSIFISYPILVILPYFLPHSTTSVTIVLGAFLLVLPATTVIAGLAGWVYGHKEARALQEIVEQMEALLNCIANTEERIRVEGLLAQSQEYDHHSV